MGINAPRGEKPLSATGRIASWLVIISMAVVFGSGMAFGLESCQRRVTEIVG